MKSSEGYAIPKTSIVFSLYHQERAGSSNAQLKETPQHFLFLLKLPGLKKDEINVELCLEKHLIISTKTGEFQTYTLPEPIRKSSVKASYANGTLQVLVQKLNANENTDLFH